MLELKKAGLYIANGKNVSERYGKRWYDYCTY